MKNNFRIIAAVLLGICALGKIIPVCLNFDTIIEYSLILSPLEAMIVSESILLSVAMILLTVGALSRMKMLMIIGIIVFAGSDLLSIFYTINSIDNYIYFNSYENYVLIKSVGGILAAAAFFASIMPESPKRFLGTIAAVLFLLLFAWEIRQNLVNFVDQIFFSDLTIDTVLWCIIYLSTLLMPAGLAVLSLCFEPIDTNQADTSDLHRENLRTNQPSIYAEQRHRDAMSIEDLRAYANLLNNGTLTAEEFAAIKKQFLNQ